ncbi:MAG: hypothetical protein O9353_07630, partial [Bacteroidia bacterium]|nr:hypothetical protein [Bacteroidia bacterium]
MYDAVKAIYQAAQDKIGFKAIPDAHQEECEKDRQVLLGDGSFFEFLKAVEPLVEMIEKILSKKALHGIMPEMQE